MDVVIEPPLAREGSVGLIVPDALRRRVASRADAAGIRFGVLGQEAGGSDEVETEFDQHLDVVPASLAKGLEFDHVVLLEPAAIVAGEPDRVTGLRRLYVCLTRAVTSLVVRTPSRCRPSWATTRLTDRRVAEARSWHRGCRIRPIPFVAGSTAPQPRTERTPT